MDYLTVVWRSFKARKSFYFFLVDCHSDFPLISCNTLASLKTCLLECMLFWGQTWRSRRWVRWSIAHASPSPCMSQKSLLESPSTWSCSRDPARKLLTVITEICNLFPGLAKRTTLGKLKINKATALICGNGFAEFHPQPLKAAKPCGSDLQPRSGCFVSAKGSREERAAVIQRIFKGCLWPGHLCLAAAFGKVMVSGRGALGVPWGRSHPCGCEVVWILHHRDVQPLASLHPWLAELRLSSAPAIPMLLSQVHSRN